MMRIEMHFRLLLILLTAWATAGSVSAQPPLVPPVTPDRPTNREGTTVDKQDAAGQPVVAVRILGPSALVRKKVLPLLKTRPGRRLELDQLEKDVRELTRSGWFIDVRTYTQSTPDGVIVIFDLLERPLLHYVKFIGNRQVGEKRLAQEAQINEGDPLDTWAVEEAARRIEDYYHEHGYPDAKITILEGNKPKDSGAVFLINEGKRQKILWTGFVGNTVASDSRLRTQVQMKPGFLWIFQGNLSREELDADVERLTAYYRKLGFFQAKVGRTIDVLPHPFDDSLEWVKITYVIDEGVRYRIADIRFFGNTQFPVEELLEKVELKPGDYFNQDKVQLAIRKLQDKYGAHGYVFADVEVDPRFRESPGQLDLVFNIKEGSQYRVGRIDVRVKGDFPHTKVTTVLNRMSLAPGDIADVREMRASEVRLRRSQLFEVDMARGIQPKIVYSPPDLEDIGPRQEKAVAERPQTPDREFRGQNPPRYRTAEKPPVAAPSDSASSPTGERIVRGQYTPGGGAAIPTPPWLQPSSRQSQTAQTPSQAYPTNRSASSSGADRPTYVESSGVVPADGTGYASTDDPGVVQTAIIPGEVPPFMRDVAPGPEPPANTAPFYGPQTAPYDPTTGYTGEQLADPLLDLPMEAIVQEARTGRLMFSIGVNSDSGLIGTALIEEQNFDITRWPRSFREIVNGTAWRGAGQRFRLEAMPGTQLQRYLVSFQEPYLFDRNVSLSLKGYYYDRGYSEWFEQRIGGDIGFGYQFTHDLSGTISYRGANVAISDPVETYWGVPPDIQAAVGDNALHGFEVGLVHDTRDSTFLPTQGHLFQASFEQVIGSYSYPRFDISMKRFFMLRERPDGSGRHVLGLSGRFAWTGDDTPVYDRYFAGGFTNLRGFRYRGASPRQYGEVVGGNTLVLASAEYMFPITADDLVRGVVFVDTGTVEPSLDNWTDTYRVAPGFGLRIIIPAMGPAPIALDFAFPVSENPGDENQVFSFFVGFLR